MYKDVNWKYSGKTLSALLLVLLAFTLGACKRNENGQLPVSGGEAIQTQAEKIEGFGLIRAYAAQENETLVLSLEFSQPLVGTQDFDKLLRFEEAVDKGSSWGLSNDGKTLRYPFVQTNENYTIIISADLLAADGGTLGTERTEKVYTGALEPVLGFASQGSILPARESRGLPVVSINSSEADVEFFRVKEASLSTFFSEYQRSGRRSSWELEDSYSDRTPLFQMADSIYMNRFLLEGKENERVLTYLPIQQVKELQEPGLYFAVMKQAGRFASDYDTSFFTVSDIGLHTRAYKEKLFVHTASLLNGAPLNGAELRILNVAGEIIFRGQTDANGNALLDYTLNSSHTLIAERGKDVSILSFNQPALDLSEFAVTGRQNAWFDVFMWSGRDLYRPGETVRLSGLLRDNDGKAIQAQPVFLRLKQPDGKIFRNTQLQPGEQGYISFEQLIPASAPTGSWQVELRTDPESQEVVHGMTLRIEEFLPERMKLDLDSATPVIESGKPLKLEATAAYLYGAPAQGNRFTARLSVRVEQHPLENMPGYFFGDPTITLPRTAEDVVDEEFGDDGIINVDIPLPEEVKPDTTVAAIVSASVYETGGRTVTRMLKRVVWPADAIVGVRPLFDDKEGVDSGSAARFELMRVDAQGNPKPAKNLQITLVRELRDYHWSYRNGGGWGYDFVSRFENKETKTVDAGTTAIAFDFPVEWGEYRVDVHDPETGLTTRYPFYAGWSWNNDNRGLDARPDKVKLALDKTSYRAGDTLKVTVTPPHEGRGLLMVESDKMLYTRDVDVKAGSVFEIPVTEEWERHDVYISMLVFRGGSASNKITPARAVGEAHVPMNRADRQIEVNIEATELMQPEKPLDITVSAPAMAGKPAHVTISAVDVGILNITNFPVPDAGKYFFAQRRLGIDAYDVYGRVIESYEGNTGKLRYGGDMGLEAMPQAKRPTADVQTVDLFSGAVQLDAQGKATVSLPVPNFNGTLRISALVYSDTHYGKSDQETVIRAPIVAEASMPRVLAPGDRSTVTLDVQNFTGKDGEFKVQLDTEGPLTLSEGTRTVTLKDGAKSTLSFPLTAQEGHTVAKIRVRVEGGGIKTDRRYDLPVRAAWPSVLLSRTQVLDALSTVILDNNAAAGLMPGSINARMMVSALPAIPFASALDGALNYPYGCTEQTTSKGFAALMLDATTAQMLGANGLSDEKRRERMEGALSRLASMQVSSGYFSVWGNDDYVNPWITPYVVEFMLDAKKAGFAVPEHVLQKALDRLSDDMLSGGNQFYGYDQRDRLKFSNQAYAAFVLARVNRAPLGTLRTLYDNERSKAVSGLSLVHLGIALSLQGDKRRGEQSIEAGFAIDNSQRSGYMGDYGSYLRDESLIIALVHENNLSKPAYDARVIAVSRELNSRRKTSSYLWLSTQEQVALARVGRALMVNQTNLVSGRLSVGDNSEDVAPGKLFARNYEHTELVRGVRFEPQGNTPLYASLDIAGVPRQAPSVDNSVVGIERLWYTLDGKAWSGGSLKEGEALIVEVKMTTDRNMPDALLTDLLPAGLEVENFNLSDASQWGNVTIDGVELSNRTSGTDLKYEEFRDDRYVAAINLRRGRTAKVFYLVRAVTPGVYTVPPPMVEDMYMPELRGVGRAIPSTFTVTQP